MAYWLKVSKSLDNTYNEFGDQVNYCVTRYYGPFRELSHLEATRDYIVRGYGAVHS